MNIMEFHNKFWNFYLELENEFLEIEKTIPIHEINYNTFSYSYVRLLGLICSEIDSVFKKFIEFKDFSIERNNMVFYKKFIEENYDGFIENDVYCSNIKFYYLKLKPFLDWNSDKNLRWWDVNSEIKHNRDEKKNNIEVYKLANQKNVLDALSALFQLNMYFHRELAEKIGFIDYIPDPKSQIFELKYLD